MENYKTEFKLQVVNSFLAGEGGAEIKAAAAHRGGNAMNNDARFGQWSYHVVSQRIFRVCPAFCV